MKTIGILYICTGKYDIFWKDFYESSKLYFLKDLPYEKHYFVFTDAEYIEYEHEKYVHKIYQKPLKWPFIASHRYKILNSISARLKDLDYLYFFNANMLFVDKVDESFFPESSQQFSFLEHPGFFNKNVEEFTYDNNPNSLAYIGPKEGKHYFAAGVAGGVADKYLLMLKELEQNVDTDEQNDIIALWHDESHLNRYAINHQNIIKVLDPSYGYPEGWDIPYKPKIIIRDKNNYGGHDFLRNIKTIPEKELYNQMIIVNIVGGLGNQMFQYAIGKALAIKSKQKLKLDLTSFENYPLRNFELDVFNIDSEIASEEESNQLKQNKLDFKEKYFHFDSEILDLDQSAFLVGYWQSEKYFIDFKDIILEEFILKNELSHQSNQFQKAIASTNSVSLHIRRGDYVTNPTTNSFHGTCSLEYYKNAVSLINNRIDKPHFFIFSDDLDWAKENLYFIDNITFVELDENIPDYEEMYLMSQCKHNIIANSSFSWWGAWLNQNVDKIVIAPQKWFEDETIDTIDLIPDSWLRLSDEPINHQNTLTKIFFLIPTCEKYSHKANTIRKTWGKDLPKFGFKHLFLMGRPELKQAMVEGDTLYVPCEDNYESLLLKLILGYEYLYEHFEFDYVYKIDDDCFLDIEKFKANIYPQIHSKKYFGSKVNPKGSKLDTKWHFEKCTHPNFEKPFSQNEVPFDYALGGFGYLLQREILPTLIAHKDEFKKELEAYVYSFEDVRIGEILYHQQIVPIQIKNFTIVSATNYIGSTHYLVYDIENPQLMFKIERDLEDQKPTTPMKQIESSLVSVIIPAFNVEKDISRCLDSIINQTHKNIEVIIVNDASTDKTRNIVEQYIQMDQRIICIDKEKNAGLLQARMTGIEKAKGEYIYSVDSDDFVMPDLIKDTLIEALKHHADIVQFPMKLASEDSKYTYNWTRRDYQEYDKNNFFLHNGNSCTIMFKKELGDVLTKYIGSLSVNYHEDYIISIILSAFYKKVRYIDTAYYVYCDTDTSMTRQYSDDALLKYIRDTLIFTRFMTDLVPIIFPKENSDYLFTVVNNRIRIMKKQLNLYFKKSKNISIYNLYNETDKNKTFITNSMLYDTILIKDQQINQQTQELQQRAHKINQQTHKINQQTHKIDQQTQELQQRAHKINQQAQELRERAHKINQQAQELRERAHKINQQAQELRQRNQWINQLQSQNKALVNNRWYHFGQMSNKRKIWTIGKVISKKIKLYWLLQPIAKLIKKY